MDKLKTILAHATAVLMLCSTPAFSASTTAHEKCMQESVEPMGSADFGWVRATPSLTGNGLWKLSQGSTVQWCGLSQSDFRGITWAWVSFKSVQEPWDHEGWMSFRILSEASADRPVQSTASAPAPVASVPVESGRSAYVPPAGYTPLLPQTPTAAADDVPKIAATIVPIESDATIYDEFKGNSELMNELVTLVKENDYRCDSISGVRPFIMSHGFALICNRFRYSYDIEDKGGHWKVTVK